MNKKQFIKEIKKDPYSFGFMVAIVTLLLFFPSLIALLILVGWILYVKDNTEPS